MQGGAAVNDGPCSAIFYRGTFSVVYPESDRCCAYNLPVWAPDSYVRGNATFGGTVDLERHLPPGYPVSPRCIDVLSSARSCVGVAVVFRRFSHNVAVAVTTRR